MRVKSKVVPTPGTLVQYIKNQIQKEGVKGIISQIKPETSVNIWGSPHKYIQWKNKEIYSPSLKETGTRKDLLNKIYAGSLTTKEARFGTNMPWHRGHLQQSHFRKGTNVEDDVNFLQPKDIKKEVNSYVEKGTGRELKEIYKHQKGDRTILGFIHPDFKTPNKFINKMDFKPRGTKIKLLGEDTGFTTQSEGFMTNQIRNESYHKHLENRLTRWLTEKKLIEQAFKDKKITKGRMKNDMETTNTHISNIERDMRKLGLVSAIWDNAKKSFNYYGKPYDKQVEGLLEDMQKTYMLRNPPYNISPGYNKNLIEYWMKKIGHNDGGLVDYGEMKPVVPTLDPGERQNLVKGGSKKGPIPTPGTAVQYIKRQVLPKVIGHTTKIMDKLTAPKGDVVVKPWAVVDRDGLPIKDFKTEKDAEKWLYDKKETVPENEYYESTIDYSVKPVEQIKTAPVVEETPAIMWKAPEVISNAPMEIAQGKQWLGILKKAGVSPKELDDTSLAPFLEIHEPNTKFTKAQLLKEFDDLVPKIEVLTTGKRDQSKYLKNIVTKFNSVRDSISDFSGKDQGVLNSFAGILQKVNAAKTDKELSVLANQTNKIMKQGYGINNALMSDQIPTIRQIPAPIRSIFGDMQELFKTRGAAHAFDKKPSHAGDQVLPGGVNYREYMFKYTPNQFRGDEPRYTPGHSFSFSDDVAQNTFVHARISDRTDNFGRKLLFVEEIQSDMHQRPQKRIREGESSGYATRQDKIVGAEPLIQELKVLQNKIDAILAREPNHSSLPALYQKRGTLADKIEKIRLESSGTGKGGNIPEGPFQRSEDYGSFVMKYLLRLAKEGNYDGVAVSTGSIKNRKGYGSEEETKGHYGFYDKIMQKVLKKIAKNADLEYNRTVINDGAVNWGNVPILILKEVDKVMKGLPSFREGGLNRENFVDVVPLL
jgi:hypothetical protein